MERAVPAWLGPAAAALSGILLTVTMPGYDAAWLGWVALVPVLAVLLAERRAAYWTALVFGLVFSVGVHSWYPSLFPPALGAFLIVAVGAFYAWVLRLGLGLMRRLPRAIAILALPVTWSAVEFIKFIAPVVSEWWFVLVAKSQWLFPPALQVLSVTGFPGLSFLVMLVNMALAVLLLHALRPELRPGLPPAGAAIAALVLAVGVLALGAATIPAPRDDIRFAVLTDMSEEGAGSEALFDLDAGLTRAAMAQAPDIVVWPENEFTDLDNADLIGRLKALAQETGAYIATDTVWQARTGKHDTAFLVAPDGAEALRRAKINITPGERSHGFVAGPADFPVVETPFGRVGIAVCWDVHRLWIMRELAGAGAEMVLLPMDNDFRRDPRFPPFPASDVVFLAVENRMTFAVGSTNGVSLVVDPYGRIVARGRVNQRGVTHGASFVAEGRTVYTRAGDWFGWVLVLLLAGLAALGLGRGRHQGI